MKKCSSEMYQLELADPVTCDVCVCSAFSGLQSAITISHIFGNNERTDDLYLLSFGVSYIFVAQKWKILAS